MAQTREGRSGVGNHSRYLALVTIRNQNCATQLLLDLMALGGQNVALLGLTAEDFPRTGLLKALGRALMGLQFGHGFPANLACFYFLGLYGRVGGGATLGLVWGEVELQVPPLRYAPVGMTKGGVALPWGIS